MSSFDPAVKDGTAFVLYAYDVGMGVTLDAAERGLKTMTERAPIKHQRKAPKYFEFEPYPLRVTQSSAPHKIGDWQTLPNVELVVYDFGAVCVTYQIPLAGPFSSLARLSELLYDNETLMADSRRLVEELTKGLGPAVAKPQVSTYYEDYAVFQVREFAEAGARARLLAERAPLVAQVLRADVDLSSEQEVQDALSCQVSYGAEDLTLVDWVSAIVLDKSAEDTRAVLEFATVQLLELRHLDKLLDAALERYYQSLSVRKGWIEALFSKADEDLKEIGQLQVEGAVLFESVNNAIKLLGDQYLARLYQQTARRHHLGSWDGSIQRKLRTLESMYDKMEHALSSARLEFIEWLVVFLIAFEIVVPFFKKGH